MGWSRDRILLCGVAAFLFGLAPDVDLLYAPLGVFGSGSVTGAVDGFWQTGNRFHREVTHSLLVGVVAVGAATFTAGDRTRSHVMGVAVGSVIVWLGVIWGGVFGGVIALVYAGVIAGVAAWCRRNDLSAQAVGLVSGIGILLHPFGDLLTGSPPSFLFPLATTAVDSRPALFPDPTLNLLAPFFLELGVIWAAVIAYAQVTDRSWHRRGWWMLGGCGYVVLVLFPAPSLAMSYHFVLPLLCLGIGIAAVLYHRNRDLFGAVVAGLQTVTVAAICYTAAYLVVG